MARGVETAIPDRTRPEHLQAYISPLGRPTFGCITILVVMTSEPTLAAFDRIAATELPAEAAKAAAALLPGI